MNIRLPPTQRRMMDVLQDGLPHPAKELHACLYDDQGPMKNISAHLAWLRSAIRPLGNGIIALRNGEQGTYYQLVRLIANS